MLQGDESCFPIITYHDIATNRECTQRSYLCQMPCSDETCFDGLFGLPDMVQLFHLFCWYHIDAPGQVRNQKCTPCTCTLNIFIQESSAQRFVDKKWDRKIDILIKLFIRCFTSYPSMTELAEQVYTIVKHFK